MGTLFSRVAEDRDRWRVEAASLVLSVGRFGGSLADAERPGRGRQ